MTSIKEDMTSLTIESFSHNIQITTPISSSSATTFTIFPTLPPELRQRIWRYTLPTPRTVLVTLRSTSAAQPKEFSTSSIIALRINQESRAEALREYGVVFFSALKTSLVVGKNDTIKVLGAEFVEGRSRYNARLRRVLLAVPGGIKKMRMICMPPSVEWRDIDGIRRIQAEANLATFAGLEALSVSVRTCEDVEPTHCLLVEIALGRHQHQHQHQDDPSARAAAAMQVIVAPPGVEDKLAELDEIIEKSWEQVRKTRSLLKQIPQDALRLHEALSSSLLVQERLLECLTTQLEKTRTMRLTMRGNDLVLLK